MKPDRLKKLLPLFCDCEFAGMSNNGLLAVSRIYVMLCNLVSFYDLDAVYGDRKFYRRKIDALFRVLQNRCGKESDPIQHGRMIRTMFDLVCGPIGAIDYKKKNICCTDADTFVGDYLETNGENPSEQASVCNCIISILYPDPDSGISYLNYLQTCISEWVSNQQTDGGWAGISAETALARIEVLNRNSYMLLDKRYDDAIQRGFGYYRNSLPIPGRVENFDPAYLPTLGRLYDAAMQGNAFVADNALAHEIAEFMSAYSQSTINRNDDWFYCMTYVVLRLCEEIAAQEHNAVLNIA